MSITPSERRLLEISYKHGLSHIGSCLSCLPIIESIYRAKAPNDLFLLGEGHAGLALYVVIEAHHGGPLAEEMLDKHGIHATRDVRFVYGAKTNKDRYLSLIPVSSGSLGQVESTAPGFALADPSRKVYLLSSDGGMQEGVCWSALRMKADLKLDSLIWHVNANGYSALDPIDTVKLEQRIHAICPDVIVHHTPSHPLRFPFLQGVDGHYCKLSAADWEWVQAQEVTQ